MTADDGFKGLERAGEHRLRLRKIIVAATAIADGLNGAVALANLKKTGERVDSDAFRVMVVGEFKRGKSTLINAMLGHVLPAYARPATAVLTELRWSEQPSAVLHPADGGPPVEVEIEDLTKHITIPKGIEQGSEQTSVLEAGRGRLPLPAADRCRANRFPWPERASGSAGGHAAELEPGRRHRVRAGR